MRRPDYLVRKRVAKQLVMNPTVPYSPARQRMVFDSIPRDFYKIAVREVSLVLKAEIEECYFGSTKVGRLVFALLVSSE